MNRKTISLPFSGDCIAGISGRLGDRVYYLRNNRQCVRSHVTPANPRTERQQQGRARFAGLVARWRSLGPAHKGRWNSRAKRLNMSGYNLFISVNMKKQEVRRVQRPFRAAAQSRRRREQGSRIPFTRSGISHPDRSFNECPVKRPVILTLQAISNPEKIPYRQTCFQE